jgi:hypothetical protein
VSQIVLIVRQSGWPSFLSIACYLRIFIILYADDTVILSESAEGLQEALSAFEKYCNIWKLTVNTNKSKIVVFSKKKYKTNVVLFGVLLLKFRILLQYCKCIFSMPCLFSNPHTSQE